MIYKIDNKEYYLSYTELQNKYQEFIAMPDAEFLLNLSAAVHFACVVCWLKETKSEYCLADNGIIHELVHLWHIPQEPLVNLQEIRQLFKEQLELK
jgi:hypothetical protein